MTFYVQWFRCQICTDGDVNLHSKLQKSLEYFYFFCIAQSHVIQVFSASEMHNPSYEPQLHLSELTLCPSPLGFCV